MNSLPISPNHLYVIALGSNRPHGLHGRPESILAAAMVHLQAHDVVLFALSPTQQSAAIGPSQRRYANAAALISTALPPPDLLSLFKQIERAFGRRRGQRWGRRVLDLDIILWSGGLWQSPALSIPHPHWQNRRFVTGPLAMIAGDWRDPVTGLNVRHIARRIGRPKPIKQR